MHDAMALLLIDAQVNMFAPDNMVYEGERILNTLGSLIKRARDAGVPVIYIQNNGGPQDPDQTGTPGWQIHPDLKPCADELVVQKWTPDSFYRTLLQEELADRGIRRLVLAGMQTEYCVDTTCRRACSLDYQVTLVKDGHSTYNTRILAAPQVIAHHNAVLSAFASVVEAEKVTF